MPFKPVKRKDLLKEIRKDGFDLERTGAGDWKLVDKDGNTIKPFVKITHPGDEVIASHVNEIRHLIQVSKED